jgi:O-antigen/teichoic acid export membrane protein
MIGRYIQPVRRAADALLEEQLVRNVVTLGGGTGIGQLIVAASYPVLTRLYSPRELGFFGLIMAFAYFATTALGGKYELAVVSTRSDADAAWLTTIAFWMAVPVTALATAIMYAFVDLNVLSFGSLPRWSVLLLAPILIASGWFMALRFWHVRQANFQQISRALVTQGVGRALFPIVAGFAHSGFSGLALGELGGRALAVRRLGVDFWAVSRTLLKRPWSAAIVRVMRENWRCPGLLLPAALVDALGTSLPLPVVATLFGPVAAGHFALVQRVVALPAAFITSSVSDVVHAHASEAHVGGRERLAEAISQSSKRLTVVALLVYVPLAVTSPFLFGPIFGAKWSESGILATCLAPMLAMHTIASPLTRVFVIVQRYDLKLACDVANLVLPITALYLMRNAGLVTAVAAYGVVTTLVTACVYLTVRYVAADPRPAAARWAP